MKNIRKRLFEIVEVAPANDRVSGWVDVFILSLITLNVIAMVIESVASIHALAPEFFLWLEYVSVVIFTLEYTLRLWSCTASEKYGNQRFGRLRYAISPFMLIDALAIFPFYMNLLPLDIMTGVDLRSVRSVRLFRLFRLAKFSRYSKALRTLWNAVRKKKEELIMSASILLLLILLASSVMYYAERDVQPLKFSSIPATMWWSIATLTTVGYGDVFPVTTFGQFVGSIIAILGVGMVALPTSILGSAFIEELEENAGHSHCPACGHDLSQDSPQKAEEPASGES